MRLNAFQMANIWNIVLSTKREKANDFPAKQAAPQPWTESAGNEQTISFYPCTMEYLACSFLELNLRKKYTLE